EDGDRHQRAEAAGGPAPFGCAVEAGRGRAARRPHPPPGQRQPRGRRLPLRHGREFRRLYVAGAGDQGPVHFSGDDGTVLRPPRLDALTADRDTAADAGEPLTVGTRAVSREDAATVLGHRLDALPRYISEERRVPLGGYRGLRFGLVLHLHYAPEVYLEGAAE